MTVSAEYPIVDIPQDAREDIEQLGSKPKFWVTLDGQQWLFKESRPNTGEDWAEKVAAEFAAHLGFDAATVELAGYQGSRGCISKNFVRPNFAEALVHGNEVLANTVERYDKSKIAKQSDHTVHNIVSAIGKLFPDPFLKPALEQLAEYIVFDALIGNTDRHHENWGLFFRIGVAKGEFALSIAPSYDHASALGRECLDERASKILAEKRVPQYVAAGRGGVYWQATDAKGANPLELVKLASAKYPEYFAPALAKICKLTEEDAWQMISRIPATRASDVSKQFAHAVVCHSLSELKRI